MVAPGRVLAVFRLVLKRSLNNVRLLLAAFLGLVIAVSLVSSVPIYTHGTLERLLQQQLGSSDKRPAGTVWLRHLEDSDTHATLDQYNALNAYVTNNIQWIVSLPMEKYVQYVAGDVYVFWPANQKGFIPQAQRRYGYVAWQSNFMTHVKIVQGVGLTANPTPDGTDVPVIMNQATADELHMSVGDTYIYSDVDQYNPQGVTLKIVGLWEPINPNDSYWIYDPYLFNNVLFSNRVDLFNRVFTKLLKAPHEFSWYAVFDSSAIHTVNESRVLSGLEFLDTRANTMMPSVTLYPALETTLSDFQQRAFLLNLLLFVLSVPMIAVVLYYISTSIGLIIDRQRNEIALLKSRGASIIQIISIYVTEGVLMGIGALVLGLAIGIGVAELIGDSYGFLLFAQRPPLPIWIDSSTLQYALGAVVLSILASLFPAIGAARHTIVSYKQEVGRGAQRPLWQRFFLDVLLLGIAAYGYRMLSQNHSILTIGQSSTDPNQQKLFIDPLTLLVPSVAIFGAALFFLRLFPAVSSGVSRLANVRAGASIVLALRQIARTPRQYSSLVLLLTVTLALGAFSASAAQTIDRNFSEKVFYQIPADLDLAEAWDYDQTAGVYNPPPLSAHYVKGVKEISTYNSYTVIPQQDKSQTKAQLLGIDRVTYPKVGWWRSDFANEPLGSLMNALSISDQAILVQQSFLDRYQLHVGDTVTLLFDNNTPVDFYIADTIKEFPTLYPDQGFIFVANLNYIYDQIGLSPYHVWFKLDPNARSLDVINELRDNGIKILSIQDSRVAVNSGRLDPQRTGLFGVLSVGFAVAAVLTVLGFFLYSFLSFERRLLQFGILRAMGLTVRQLFGLLMFEQVYLIILGVAVGTGLGVYAGKLFIPFFQVSTGFQNAIPPFVVQTAWDDVLRIYVILGVMLALGLSSTGFMIARMKLYRTVKLGEES